MKLMLQIAGGIVLATAVIYGAMAAMWEPLMKAMTRSTMGITKDLMSEFEDD